MITTRDAFGKLQRDDAGATIGWHPLIHHMVDVARCFERLLCCRSVRRSLVQAAGRALTPQDVERLAVLVLLHDIGKANCGFQAKRWSGELRHDGWPSPSGHGAEALLLFTETLMPLAEKLPLDEIDAWGDSAWQLLLASISHHGRPILAGPMNWNRAIWMPVKDREVILYDPGEVLEQIGKCLVKLYPDAFRPEGGALPDNPGFCHLFAGLVQLADWIGSDTGFFPYSQKDENRGDTALRYADTAIKTLGLDAEDWRERLAELSPTFDQTFGNSPFPIQSVMNDSRLGPLVILESETGSGKTEAALWRFLHLFNSGRVDSLYFALPTRVSASQIYRRIQVVVEHLWPHAAPVVVRALPGYAAADGHEVKALPDFKVLWPDNPDDAVAHGRWAAESPKRFLAAPIAVGTVDQALFGTLQVRHAHLRHALLARSLLVVDEVHASDPYMTVLLERLLRAHLRCGGHTLLLSATLGSSARTRYLALAQQEVSTAYVTTGFDAAKDIPYPAVSDFSGIRGIASTAKRKAVSWTAHDTMDNPEHIARIALDAAREGAKVLVIRNTVPAAVAVLEALETSGCAHELLFNVAGIVTLHHSRFSRQDRPLLDEAIEAQLGRSRSIGACIAIGTQTLEQSLDLDADLLITDLCPMDVLLQRVGRLHRHSRADNERPASFRTAQVRVLMPPEHDLEPMLHRPRHGLGRFRDGGGVYADLRVVEATRRLIAEHPTVVIPDDNRYLVEAATHPERLMDVEQSGGEAWLQLGQAVDGDTGAERGVGHLHALDTDMAFDDVRNVFSDDVKIATRLGAQDRLLRFEPPPPGPFGRLLRELPVRHYLLPQDLDPDAQPEDVVHRDGTSEFTLGEARYRYSRLGLERLSVD